MASDYTAISVTTSGRDAARRMAAAMTGHTGQRISMSDALRIAELVVAGESPGSIRSAAAQLGLIPTPPEGTDQ